MVAGASESMRELEGDRIKLEELAGA